MSEVKVCECGAEVKDGKLKCKACIRNDCEDKRSREDPAFK